MPNIAAVLKSEIARIARKEIKQEAESLKKAAAAHRREIAVLKKRLHELEVQAKSASKRTARQVKPDDSEEPQSAHRFSAKGLAALRGRLALSAADFGRLIGASALSVYKWEQGKAHPRAKYLSAIAAVRGIGKREATKRLAALS